MFMAFRRCTHLPATPPKCQLMRGGPGVSRPIKLIDHGATKKKGGKGVRASVFSLECR